MFFLTFLDSRANYYYKTICHRKRENTEENISCPNTLSEGKNGVLVKEMYINTDENLLKRSIYLTVYYTT